MLRKFNLSLCLSFSLLFLTFSPAPADLSVEEQQEDESLDARVVQLIREQILPYSTTTPESFIARIMTLLNRGSIHSANTACFLGKLGDKTLDAVKDSDFWGES